MSMSHSEKSLFLNCLLLERNNLIGQKKYAHVHTCIFTRLHLYMFTQKYIKVHSSQRVFILLLLSYNPLFFDPTANFKKSLIPPSQSIPEQCRIQVLFEHTVFLTLVYG